MHKRIIGQTLLVTLILSGCVSPTKERERAIATAQARFESQGKQLHVINLNQEGVANLIDYHTTIDFKCVRPGEDGYVPAQPNEAH